MGFDLDLEVTAARQCAMREPGEDLPELCKRLWVVYVKCEPQCNQSRLYHAWKIAVELPLNA